MRPAARILLAEADALPPILRATPASAFDLPTVLPGWSVRDVLAHCSGAMHHVAAGTLHGFTPEDNEADVAHRRGWELSDLIAELVGGYRVCAEAIDAAGGLLDGMGLGEWVHGGDVRLALGHDDAYISAGVEYALDLIVERSVARSAPCVTATVGARQVVFGVGDPAGAISADLATLIRLVSGRGADPSGYRLSGVAERDLVLFT